MSSGRDHPPHEVEQLTTAIREMASRVSAEFVPSQEKTQNFIAASKQREKRQSSG
jgi:hypothetical protein